MDPPSGNPLPRSKSIPKPRTVAAAQSWIALVERYQVPHTHKAVWQICNSILPLLAVWTLMYFSLRVHYALTLLLSLPAVGLLIRTFIIQHDCGHGSFFKSQRANDALGFVCGILTLTPYAQWRRNHAIHHATASLLERRGTGDIWTLTVDEYFGRSPWRRFLYRLYRNPLVLFVVGPSLQLVVLHRFPARRFFDWDRGRASILCTNLGLVGLYTLLGSTVGWRAVVLVQVPIVVLAASLGTWFFYVQHQFERTYWATNSTWDYSSAALQGSSYYKLPRLLQWFTGNIGFHHIHHLSHRIPNYNLQRCHDENPEFQRAQVLTLRSSLRTIQLRLWDENRQRLIAMHQIERTPKPLQA